MRLRRPLILATLFLVTAAVVIYAGRSLSAQSPEDAEGRLMLPMHGDTIDGRGGSGYCLVDGVVEVSEDGTVAIVEQSNSERPVAVGDRVLGSSGGFDGSIVYRDENGNLRMGCHPD